MYYKIRNDILFRQYKEYGYITDQLLFIKKFLNTVRRINTYVLRKEDGCINGKNNYPKCL